MHYSIVPSHKCMLQNTCICVKCIYITCTCITRTSAVAVSCLAPYYLIAAMSSVDGCVSGHLCCLTLKEDHCHNILPPTALPDPSSPFPLSISIVQCGDSWQCFLLLNCKALEGHGLQAPPPLNPALKTRTTSSLNDWLTCPPPDLALLSSKGQCCPATIAS